MATENKSRFLKGPGNIVHMFSEELARRDDMTECDKDGKPVAAPKAAAKANHDPTCSSEFHSKRKQDAKAK